MDTPIKAPIEIQDAMERCAKIDRRLQEAQADLDKAQALCSTLIEMFAIQTHNEAIVKIMTEPVITMKQ